jgi:hypothetical protein
MGMWVGNTVRTREGFSLSAMYAEDGTHVRLCLQNGDASIRFEVAVEDGDWEALTIKPGTVRERPHRWWHL